MYNSCSRCGIFLGTVYGYKHGVCVNCADENDEEAKAEIAAIQRASRLKDQKGQPNA